VAISPAKLETGLGLAGLHGDTDGDLLTGSRTGTEQLQLAC